MRADVNERTENGARPPSRSGSSSSRSTPKSSKDVCILYIYKARLKAKDVCISSISKKLHRSDFVTACA